MLATKTTIAIEVQQRDLDVLRGLFECRLMTLRHMAALYFNGSGEAAKKRVQKLKAAGLVGEKQRQAREPSILVLRRKGFDALHRNGRTLDGFPAIGWKSLAARLDVKPLTIEHELDVMTVKAALVPAINSGAKNSAGGSKKDRSVVAFDGGAANRSSAFGGLSAPMKFSVAQFSTWPVLYQFDAHRPPWEHEHGKSSQKRIQPDGFIRVHEVEGERAEQDGADSPDHWLETSDTRGHRLETGATLREIAGRAPQPIKPSAPQAIRPRAKSEHAFFLEVDRGPEKLDIVAGKAWCYRDYYERGGFAARLGYPRADYKQCPFVVLMVFPSAERRNNVAERLLQLSPPILTQTWLTTFAEITADPLGAIWITPLTYRAAVKGTAFDVNARRDDRVYRRQTEREKVVSGSTRKFHLLEAGERT